MENKYQLFLGGRVALSGCCEGCIETTNCNQTKYILKYADLDTADEHRLLDQRSTI